MQENGGVTPIPLRHVEMPDRAFDPNDWEGVDSSVSRRVLEKSREAVDSYRSDPLLVDEHANKELGTAQGGYGRRQVYELVQNAADELRGHPGGMVKLLLTSDAMYCANQGSALTVAGVNALLMSDLSVKRGHEIGRFGLGFKSVLAITKRPTFLSRSGSFRFDPVAAEHLIRGVVPTAERVPYLRTATPIDPVESAKEDDVLKELMAWATTVVKLPRDELAAHEWLRDDLSRFPGEFLLFSPHVGSIAIEDRTSGLYRQMSVGEHADGYALSEDGRLTEWMVFQRDHRPSPKAKEDAGEIARRDVVPIVWAVQRDSRGRGDFWAFFPTEVRTTLSGIINAPWKTNEDRQNLLRGAFNEELLGVVADLVVGHLADLQVPGDPGRPFDILPARGREAPSWADEMLTDAIYQRASSMACIPDQNGLLQTPQSIWLGPTDLPTSALSAWAACDDRPMDWAHHSVETRERRPRVDRLVDSDHVANHAEWLYALSSTATPQSSIAAIRAAAACLTGDVKARDTPVVRSARIVLTRSGEVVAADPSMLFLEGSTLSSRARFVHDDVAANPEALQILKDFGIRSLGDEEQYSLMLKDIPLGFRDWERFWRATASLPHSRAIELIRGRPQAEALLRVRTLSGEYFPMSEVLLPGTIVHEDEGADHEVAVDMAFHSDTIDVLYGLGVRASPIPGGMFSGELSYREYLAEKQDDYFASFASLRQKPSRDYLELDHKDVVGPLDPALSLSRPALGRFISALLALDSDDRTWHIRHATKGEYPSLVVEDPGVWFIRERGVLPTTLGTVAAFQAVGPALQHYSDVLPVVQCSDEWATKLGLPMTLDAITLDCWGASLARVLGQHVEAATRLYIAAARYVERPAQLRAYRTTGPDSVPAEQVFITADPRAYDAALADGNAVLIVSSAEEVGLLSARWDLRSVDGLVSSHVEATVSSEPRSLVEMVPALREFMSRHQARLEIVGCTDLQIVSIGPGGSRHTSVSFASEESRIYWVEAQGNERLLNWLNDELRLSLTNADIEAILADQTTGDNQKLLVEVRAQPDAPSKLLRAIGEERIKRHLPATLIQSVTEIRGPLTEIDVAGLAASVFGIDLFKEYRAELSQAGLNPPERWSGSQPARRFILSLALARQYAGYEEPRRDPLFDVEGPATLPDLHDFQREITVRIRELLKGSAHRRALLALPTGAGKTRVAVEALVDAIREGELEGPILWTAPTGELCEQAVQTWAYVWRAIGPNRRLHISRLWEGNEAEEIDDDGIQVVIATDAKMGIVIQRDGYEWLAGASVVIVDEAHGSIDTGYTKILHWLGLGRDQDRDRCPLLGLTATPFKGTSVEATERLARRYGSRLLSEGVLGDDPHRRLQEMEVLAVARQRVLGGSTIELTAEEAAKAKELNKLPAEVEERVGKDQSRNRAILDTIAELPADWKILVFAASVSHAEHLAAMLNLQDIASAVISSKTHPAARRHYVAQFNSGALRVLTNYGVFAEGFDSPSVRAVVVARPTLSPNVYQQMIGRGLRGPRNGGKKQCLVINVEDNILRFGGDLAFHHFDYLFENR